MSTTKDQETRVVIVTGGSGGIGRASARRLAQDGYAVVVHYSGNQDAADAAVADVTAAGGQGVAIQGDVADENAVKTMFDQAEERFGGVDVVVHTAGQMKLAPLAELDLAEFDTQHRVNLRGTFVVCQQAVQRLRGGGSILTFSSSVVEGAFPTYSAYSASKGAVEAMSLILARELRGRDVTVNAVAPGPVATSLFLEGKSQEEIDEAASRSPLGRLGTPEDIAEVVAFLASPQGHWVNGQTIRVNGGMI
jgi:3-oxoacyl-[acyl-carrier protein] reductase